MTSRLFSVLCVGTLGAAALKVLGLVSWTWLGIFGPVVAYSFGVAVGVVLLAALFVLTLAVAALMGLFGKARK